MTTATVNRSWEQLARLFWEWAVVGPYRAAMTYAPQFLITSASVAMNAGFAQSHGILDPTFAWMQAVGFEWTYLRGLAYAGKSRSRWVDALNIGAFVAVVLYGIMFCLVQYKVFPEQPGPLLSGFLSVVHVLPIGFTSLCAAMIHRDVERSRVDEERAAQHLEDERKHSLRIKQDELNLETERKRQELAIEMEREQSKLELWTKAQHVKRELSQGGRGKAASRPPAAPISDTERKCPNCGASLTGSEWGAYRSVIARGGRWQGCKQCKTV